MSLSPYKLFPISMGLNKLMYVLSVGQVSFKLGPFPNKIFIVQSYILKGKEDRLTKYNQRETLKRKFHILLTFYKYNFTSQPNITKI